MLNYTQQSTTNYTQQAATALEAIENIVAVGRALADEEMAKQAKQTAETALKKAAGGSKKEKDARVALTEAVEKAQKAKAQVQQSLEWYKGQFGSGETIEMHWHQREFKIKRLMPCFNEALAKINSLAEADSIAEWLSTGNASKAESNPKESPEKKMAMIQLEMLADLLLQFPELNPEKKVLDEIRSEYKAGRIVDEEVAKILKQNKVPLQYLRKKTVVTEAIRKWEEACMDIILPIKGFGKFSKQRNPEDNSLMSSQVYNQNSNHYYGGLELTLAIVDAKTRYGIPDEASGQQYEFLHLVNGKYKKSERNLVTAAIGEGDFVNHELKQRKLREVLRSALKEARLKAEAKGFTVKELEALNQLKIGNADIAQDNLKKIMGILKADAALWDEVDNILEYRYTENLNAGAGEAEEDNTASLRKLEHEMSKNSGYILEDEIFRITDKENLLKLLAKFDKKVLKNGSRNNKADLKPFLTMKLFPLLVDLDHETIREAGRYLDRKFMEYFLKAKQELPHEENHESREAEILAAYHGIKYETTLKRIRSLVKLLATEESRTVA